MKSHIKVIIRIILIFLLLDLLIMLTSYSAMISTYGDMYPELLIYIGVGIIGTLILGFLWWQTDWLVSVLAGNLPEDSLVISTSNLDLFKMALRLLGFFLIFSALPDLVGHIGYRLSFPFDYYEPNQFQAALRGELLNITVTLLLGLLLTSIGGKPVRSIRGFWNPASLTDTQKDYSENL